MFHSAPECNSYTHISMVFVSTIIFVPFLAGFVITQYKATHKQVIYMEDVAHEMFLRSRELEYLLGVNDHWGVFVRTQAIRWSLLVMSRPFSDR